MSIENIRYYILSQKSTVPETTPVEGKALKLRVVKKYTTEDEHSIETATIHADHVIKHGLSSEVMGVGQTESIEKDLPCVAVYDVQRVYPKNKRIGTLVFKHWSE